jgi:hypothetical protein
MSFPKQGTEGSLQDYIERTPYGTGAVDTTVVADIDTLLAMKEHPLNIGLNADDGTDRLEDEPGVTTPAQTPEPAAESLQAQLVQAQEEARRANEALQKQEQDRQNQAMAAAQMEYRRIQTQINQIPDPDERQAEQARFDAHRLKLQNDYLTRENSTLKSKQQADEQEGYRQQVITGTIAKYGLPFSARESLEAAQTPEQLDKIVAGLLKVLPKQTTNQQRQTPQQQAALQQRIASGAEAAGGAVASQVPPEGPKKHSGDIIGLIQSTNYNLVRTRE